MWPEHSTVQGPSSIGSRSVQRSTEIRRAASSKLYCATATTTQEGQEHLPMTSVRTCHVFHVNVHRCAGACVSSWQRKRVSATISAPLLWCAAQDHRPPVSRDWVCSESPQTLLLGDASAQKRNKLKSKQLSWKCGSGLGWPPTCSCHRLSKIVPLCPPPCSNRRTSERTTKVVRFATGLCRLHKPLCWSSHHQP